ncbi:hypothetical protein EVG20_g8798 [Dentipellis fragilis]|uniref:Uncharacterized protein n=1 Tax=Dentipellis fragilis TaxID=205917 RepID=A0A4Y9Y315_9AGAM|nr:hypothetical protein EVG20_g8798 [Dentipellis fragilis]
MGNSSEASALGPIDPSSVHLGEEEKNAPWIVRKLVGWGDSSPFLLPCVRFRDLVVHTVIAATGGMAAVAAPVMGPVSDVIVNAVGDSILVEVGMHAGFKLSVEAANDLVFDKPIKNIIPAYDKMLESTHVKTILITLKYKHTLEDASLGFYRSSLHQDNSLFASVMDYLAVEKGWFNPYLFASGRRPIIPRSMRPDVIFCHGPFLSAKRFRLLIAHRVQLGDYKIGQTLLAESASVITLAHAPPPETATPARRAQHPPTTLSLSNLPTLSNMFARSRTPSPEPTLTPLPAPPDPAAHGDPRRRAQAAPQVVDDERAPERERDVLPAAERLPAIVVPVKVGAPLVAWDGLTLEQLWKVPLPQDGDAEPKPAAADKYEGIVSVFFEYLDMCVDWSRAVLPEIQVNLEDGDEEKKAAGAKDGEERTPEEEKKDALRTALRLLVAGAIRSGQSKVVKDEVDKERSGIAMWRIP